MPCRLSHSRVLALVVPLALLVLLVPAARSDDVDLAGADRLFEEKHYQEAADAYARLVTQAPDEAGQRHASQRLVICDLRLRKFQAALDAADAEVERTKGTPWEARARRLAGNLWVNIPHWGTRAGGVFHRGEWRQGIQLRSVAHDKRVAIEHLEAARELYAAWDAPERTDERRRLLGAEKDAPSWREERLGCLFDLSGACARFGIYEPDWSFWWGFWAERDDLAADTAGEDDFQEMYSSWELRRKRPIGLRIGPDGQPLFPRKPDAWAADLPDDEKILFLLDEVRRLDDTDDRKPTARSFYRQAMLARARFGLDRLNQIAGIWWSDETFPLQEDLKAFRPWELGDAEALVLAGGRIQRVTLPADFDVIALLARIPRDLEASGLGAQATYAWGLHLQSRQLYVEALDRYRQIESRWPEAPWATHAQTQVQRILRAQVHVNQTGVQLPGEPARVQLSYRNATKAYFVAYRIDLPGFLKALREQPFDELRGPRDLWALGNWPWWFTQEPNEGQWARKLARDHVKEEVARWAHPLEDDGTHRYREAVVPTPLSTSGAYLVLALLEDPAARETEKSPHPLEDGASRAVVVLTDLALVEKPTKEGRLYLVADARSGAPVPGATIDVVEFWSIWDQSIRKSRHYREAWQHTTDEVGLAAGARPTQRQTGNLHVLVTAGTGDEARLAWSGMEYWSWYSPSEMQEGRFAYCITDRPVYRPGHTVRFKAWLRSKRHGIYANEPGESWHATVWDPRGNKVHEASGQTDAYGGLDGSFTLGEEPTLGVYRLALDGVSWQSGQTFRVEEYKKPEFEVTVEPSATLAKLGESVQAKVRATYYFGAPVVDAEVRYEVFREEYRQTAYPPGRWDWLYGPGYGLAWYAADWFPWWGEMLSCWMPPPWWWGFYGGGYGRSAVRELVAQGEGRTSAEGTLELSIDTQAAKRDHPDRDHRYVVRAEVRDASRRVIQGEGAVKVTRQPWYAFVHALQGWVRPGEELVLRVRCVTPDGAPVQTRGVLSVAEVKFGGPGNATIEQTEVDRMTIETDAGGQTEVRFRHEKSGQLLFRFEAPAEWGGTVKGYGLVWVCGEDFDGAFHRFDDLELITDRRTYRPGETARVMVNTKRADAWVLFGDEVDSNTLLSWRMLHLPQRSTVVDVPVKPGSVPNFFVEGTTVADARVHHQIAQICVPPEDGLIEVEVETDRSEYRPGEKAGVKITARQADGSPAKAQVAISAFDRSVLYIQEEMTPPIARVFHGGVRRHQVALTTNLTDLFASWGGVERPYQQIGPLPPDWSGIWGPRGGDWRVAAEELMDALGGGDGWGLAEGAASPPPGAPAPSAAAGDDAGIGEGAPGARGDKPEAVTAEAGEKSGLAAQAPAASDLVEAQVRARFADTALWQPALETGEDGTVETTVECPENLTTWKVNVWGMTKTTQVGQGSTTFATSKDLIVRLQAPRFFLEYDEVVLSANVHNYLETAKRARVRLDVPPELLALDDNTPAAVDVDVAAGGEVRVDWRVRVLKEGSAEITATAQTDEESDAVRMTFPVLVHGMTKQVATTASIRPGDAEKTILLDLEVPEQRRPELTRLEVRFAPSLVGAMLDALPYCLDYPYGCTEQTVSRFLPAVLARKTLQNLGVDLATLKDVRGRMAELRRIEEGEGRRFYGSYAESPVFDEAELQRILDRGRERIRAMQQADGGWGWWTRDESSPYLTSYVLFALLTARDADLAVDPEILERGLAFLEGWARAQMAEPLWREDETWAFVAHVLSMAARRAAVEPQKDDTRPGDLVERLFEGRDRLNLYGKSLLALTLANLGDEARGKTVLRNVLQYLERNDETEVAWLRTPETGWWFWWNNDIETNAWALKALTRLDPHSDVAPRLVKWLLENRKNGYYWRSTRDTTLCVSAMSDFVRASGEGTPDYVLRLDLDDGAVVKEVRIDKASFFTYDNRFVVEGVSLGGGKHTLRVTKTGPGAVYLSSYLTYFTKEEHIAAAGHEIHVARRYFRLQQVPYEVEVEGAEGQSVTERRLRYERIPVRDGDALESGDLLQVELEVTSDNTYTFLAFEDMKPAGCEPVELQSGGEGQEGFCSYVEYRDEKVAFFVGSLDQGTHLLRYRLRAEIPGTFHALPARCFAMYVPELKANSEEIRIRVEDR